MDWKSLIVTYFYNTIKSFMRQYIPAQFTLSDDIVMLIVGYLLTKYMPTYSWVGTGLIYGAVASLGAGGGLMLPGLIGRKEVESPYIPDTVVVR